MTTAVAPPVLDTTDKSIQAVAELPRDLAIIKMENDNIMSLAAAHPRDHAAVLADIKTQLATYRSFATSAMYNKPVGDGKWARGLNIRAAEAIAAAYKYNRSRIDVTPIDKDTVRVEATFVDFQDGRVEQRSGILSKYYKDKYGKQRRYSDDRFYRVTCGAEGSRLKRECILRCVPPGLRGELEEAVDAQLDALLDDETVTKVVAQFSTKAITKEMLERLIGKRTESFTKDDRAKLLGVWNAIDQGEATLTEIFDDPHGDAGKSQPPTSTLATLQKKHDDLLGKKPAATEPGTTPSEGGTALFPDKPLPTTEPAKKAGKEKTHAG